MTILITRSDRPVDPLLTDILRRVDGVAREQGIAYFVSGATARDLLLLHVFGKETGRATRDVDLGIYIDDWHALDSIKMRLLRDGQFTAHPKLAHRLMYRPSVSAHGMPLDLLPFGGVANDEAQFAWPGNKDVLMNVAGFAEAHATAVKVAITSEIVIPVASLASLAALKLIAWRDRHLETKKDATDFLLIARNYQGAGNADRLYDTESALLVACEFDPDLAGAMLLGKDVAGLCTPVTARLIEATLTNPVLVQRLTDQLLRASLSSGEATGETRGERYLGAFREGFLSVHLGRINGAVEGNT